MKIFGYNISKSKTHRPIQKFAKGKYKIVEGWGQHSIESSTTEFRTEDEILDQSKRAKLLDLTRNLVRNSSLFNTIIAQLTTNVIGSVGGKIVLSYKNEYINDILKKNFFYYTRNVDFSTGDSLNHLLKRVLREYIIGGDVVLLFDNGLIENSGKILLFESSEIVNVCQEEVEKRYGKGSYCVNGKVYSPNGRHIGTIVSKSQRGIEQADPTKCYFLRKDPNLPQLENNWFHFSCQWREGRGVSQAASAIATIHQLEDLVQTELMAARRNSQIFCWLQQQKETQEDIPSAFDNDDIENMTDEEIEKAVRTENESVQTISFNRARENSIVYEALPEGISAQQLDMQHPNTAVETMVDFLANRVAASMGLSKVFATGNPEDSNWRANQLFTRPTIVEFQKLIEGVCDWVFYRFVEYIVKNGELEYIDPEIMDYVSWSWNGIDSLDPVANQTAIRLALENSTMTYSEILGNDWKQKLEQVAEEHEWMRTHHMIHPSEKLISGGESSASKNAEIENE